MVGITKSPRDKNEIPGIVFSSIFLVAIAAWSVLALKLSWGNNVNYPTYGDVFRLVEEFVIPLDAGRENVLQLIFQEYEPLSHGHVLTRLVLLISSFLFNLNFRIFWVVGTLGYFATLYLIYIIVRSDIERNSIQKSLCTATALGALLAYIRPDELNSISSSFLFYEYIFFAGSLLYVWAYMNCLKTGRYLLYFLTLVASIVLFDVTGFIAVIASAIHGILAIVQSRFRIFRPIHYIPTISVIVLLAAKKIFFSENSDASLPMSVWERLTSILYYFVQSFGQSVIHIVSLERILADLHFPESLAAIMNIVLGVAIAIAIVLLAVCFLRYPSSTNTFQGTFLLTAFGLIAILGTFITRAGNSPDQAFAPRYVRYMSFVIFFLPPAIYFVVTKLSSLKKSLPLIAAWLGFLILLRASFLGIMYAQPYSESKLRFYDNYRSQISAYQEGESDGTDLLRYMHKRCKSGENIAPCLEVLDYISMRHSHSG